MHSITVLESRSPKTRCWQGWLLLEALRKSLPCLCQLLLASGSPWCSLPHSYISPLAFCLHKTSFPTCLCVFSSSYKDTSPCIQGPSCDLILTNYVCKDPVFKQRCSHRYWGQNLNIAFEETIQPTTPWFNGKLVTFILCTPALPPPLSHSPVVNSASCLAGSSAFLLPSSCPLCQSPPPCHLVSSLPEESLCIKSFYTRSIILSGLCTFNPGTNPLSLVFLSPPFTGKETRVQRTNKVPKIMGLISDRAQSSDRSKVHA